MEAGMEAGTGAAGGTAVGTMEAIGIVGLVAWLRLGLVGLGRLVSLLGLG
jgi:hypothetical protein